MFINLIYELPRPLFFVSNFLNLDVEKQSFGSFDFALEFFPIFKTSCCPIATQCNATLLVSPTLGLSHDIDSFWICSPCIFNFESKHVGNEFKFVAIRKIIDIDILDSIWNIIDKAFFFLTIFCNEELWWDDVFFCDGNTW